MKGSVGIIFIAFFLPVLLLVGFLFYQGTYEDTKDSLTSNNMSVAELNKMHNQTNSFFRITPTPTLMIIVFAIVGGLVGAFFLLR